MIFSLNIKNGLMHRKASDNMETVQQNQTATSVTACTVLVLFSFDYIYLTQLLPRKHTNMKTSRHQDAELGTISSDYIAVFRAT